jgi:hypothetical protein
MKRRRSRRWHGVVVAGLLDLLLATASAGQRNTAIEGAVFLLRPIGARAVGAGQAVVARQDATEGIWWNPAAVAGATRREVAIHHSQDFFATGDAIAILIPSRLLGVIAIAADVQDYGEQENTVDPSPATGTILARSFVLSATYATTIGRVVGAGVAFKIAQWRLDCTGPCDLPTSVAQTFALDGGIQYVPGGGPISLGLAVRNVGLRLQVEDSPQADPLPSRVQLGVGYRYPLPARVARELELNVSADVVDGLRIANPLPRVGAELVWQKRMFVRGGYVFEASDSESGGPSLGLGFTARNVVIDIARMFTGFSADAGQAPTYLSLRLQF